MSLLRSFIIFSCLTIVFQTPLFSQTSQDYVDSKVYEYIDDGSWCWFQDERAVIDTVKGKLVVGSTNMQSSVDVVIFDIAGKKVDSKKRFNRLDYADDHNAPALIVAPDGNYVAVWAHHYDKYKSHYSIFNGQSWAAEKAFDWNTIPGGTNYTIAYSNLYYLSSEKRMYNFARANDRAPNFLYSEDNGNTWKFGGQLTTNSSSSYNKGYYKYWGDGVDRIDMVFTEEHPRDQTTSIYHGYIQNKKLYNTKGVVADDDIYDRGKMPTFSAFTKVFAHGTKVNNVTMGRCWQHDIARYSDGTIGILFKARANNEIDDHRNFYARYDGTEWKVTYIGKAGKHIYGDEHDYVGLGSLSPDDPSRIYLCTTFNPGNDNAAPAAKREIWRGITKDNGATWTWQAVTANSTTDNFRPIVPKWKKGKEAVLWFKGNYVTAQNITAKVIGTFYDYEPPTTVNKKENGVNTQAKLTAIQIAQRVCISYSIPVESQVTLKIFSISGECVATIVNKQSLSGNYSANWNIQKVPAGTYLTRLVVNGHTQTSRISIQ